MTFPLPRNIIDFDDFDRLREERNRVFTPSFTGRAVSRTTALLTGQVQVAGMGFDASKWQASIDWQTAKEQLAFVFLRGLYGYTEDSRFGSHWSGSQAVGFKRGIYGYYLDALDPVAQAKKLHDVALKYGGLGELPPVGDIEEYNNNQLTPSKVKTYFSALQYFFGTTPICYTGKYVWDKWLGNVSWASELPLWLGQYPLVGWQTDHLNKVLNYPPAIPKPWTSFDLWQFTASAPANAFGVSGTYVDLDYASPAFAAQWLDGQPIPPTVGNDMLIRKAKCLFQGLSLRKDPFVSSTNKIGSLALNQEFLYLPELTEKPNTTDEWWAIPNPAPGYKLGYAAKDHSTLPTPGLADLGEWQP